MTKRPLVALGAAVWTLLVVAGQAIAATPQTIILRGGTVYDGTGRPARQADVVLRGDRIVMVGDAAGVQGRVIDVSGLIVCPGFIDLHNHSDENIVKPQSRAAVNYRTQGVTTIVTGNCGFGPIDVSDYYRKLADQGVGVNVAHLVPHGALREHVMGSENRLASPRELERMKRLLRRGLEAGAWGMSTGLIYTPGCYADTEELIALAAVVAEFDGLYASHIRGEDAERLWPALEEAIRIGRTTGVRVHISHFKASGPKAWGSLSRACRLLEGARAAGVGVTAGQYPYTASSTSVAAMTIPQEARAGGPEQLLKRLTDPKEGPMWRKRIAEALDQRGGPSTIMIASLEKRPEWVGKTIEQIAAETGMDPVEVIVTIQRLGGASAIAFTMREDDVRYAMKKGYVATASDGAARVPDNTLPHPRSYGCFPRKIGRYAVEYGVVSLEHAIRSCTGLPADILGLPRRGYLREGHVADVLVFDPKTFRDRATFRQPHQYSTGVVYLFVNGELVIEQGKVTGALAGKPLRKQVGPISGSSMH